MKPREDSNTIVMRGFWNRMIFSPQWVMDELFHKQEFDKLVPMAPVAPLIYRDDELVLHVADQQIIVQTMKFNVDCLKLAEKMACETLIALPKTPVSAIGVNFGFIESDPIDELLKLFNFADDVDIASSDWVIGTKKIVRQLTKGRMTLNLTLTQDAPSNILIDANFHYSVKSADDAVHEIQDHTVEMHDNLIKLLEDVYALCKEGETHE